MISTIKKGMYTLAGAAGYSLIQTSLVMAQGAELPIKSGPPTSLPRGFRDISAVIDTIFKVVITAAGVIFLLMFLFGGIQYLTSAGNEEGTGKARKLLVDAIVGLIVVLAAYAIGTWILGILGLQGGGSANTF